MEPQCAINLLNNIIIVLFVAIVFHAVLLVVRAYSLTKRLERGERRFLEETMSMLRQKKIKELYGHKKP